MGDKTKFFEEFWPSSLVSSNITTNILQFLSQFLQLKHHCRTLCYVYYCIAIFKFTVNPGNIITRVHSLFFNL